MEKKGLGRGLSALMGDLNVPMSDITAPQSGARGQTIVSIDKIQPNLNQPRRDFSEAALNDLAESIKQKGVIQPIIVRQLGETESYQIVAGERRWRASQIAEIDQIPVIIREFTDDEVIEVAIIENIQRENLNAVEEALGFRQLMDRFGHTQDKLASALSKSRSHIANTLRLLNLPEPVQKMVRSGQLSAGHARSLIGTVDAENLALRIIEKGMSVRDTENYLKQGKAPPKTRKLEEASAKNKDADTRALEADLSENLKMAVSIDHEVGGERGVVKIRYNSLDQLDQICHLLSLS